jgi:hypothetical protein
MEQSKPERNKAEGTQKHRPELTTTQKNQEQKESVWVWHWRLENWRWWLLILIVCPTKTWLLIAANLFWSISDAGGVWSSTEGHKHSPGGDNLWQALICQQLPQLAAASSAAQHAEWLASASSRGTSAMYSRFIGTNTKFQCSQQLGTAQSFAHGI